MSENSVKSESVKRRPRWLVPLVAGACIVALAGGVTGGVIAWRDGNARALADAQSKCEDSLAKVGKARAAYSKTVEGAGDVKAVKAEQVADAKVVSALASELDVEAPKTLACDAADADGLNATAGKLDAQVKWYATHEQSVKTASENVSKSRDEKTLNDARKALSDKEGTARKLLKDSDGKTSDNAARAQLTEAINTAVEAGKGSDLKKMSEAESGLDKATKSVNDAISAKQKADAAAAANAGRSQSSSSGSSRSGSGYSGWNGSNSNGYGSNRNRGGSSSSKRNTGNSSGKKSNGGKTSNGWNKNDNGDITGGSFCGTDNGDAFVPC
ncbi:hypothetical protein [Bifidobacterium bifidum]|uniref:Colicin transporter n=1 Tax=Bifidobacterium bifidum TaxID=1681 RepID=A0A415C300_BIFBI|nr:hypothetical protein [Bifidobacterium bifidum]RHJ03159.1 hypothetical protein DW145_09530 [Bifidobacterium bifidum]RHJ22087.1 hypothetical protein DW137_09710 [Bifidobacterium bifidum]